MIKSCALYVRLPNRLASMWRFEIEGEKKIGLLALNIDRQVEFLQLFAVK